MRKLLYKKVFGAGRLPVIILLVALTSALITWAQPPPPPNAELINLAEEVIIETSQALSQTLFAWSQIGFGGIEPARASIHDVINSIEGPNGPNFDSTFGQPAGQGALPAAERLLGGIRQMGGQPGGPDFVVAGENVLQFLELAVERALIALEEIDRDVNRVSEELRIVQGMLMAARGSSEEKDRPTEGGARSIKAWLQELNS